MDIQTLQTVALFEKCRQFTKAREIQAAGLYPYFKPISDSEDTSVVIEGQKRIMLGSNNYLGLTHHPKVLEAAEESLGMKKGEIQASWDCLRRVGNLSSASVLCVLEDVMLNRRPEPGTLGVMAALGPGFCSEVVLLRW